MLDHVVGFRNLLGAVFYDVGQSYLAGHWSPVVHGVGVGLRIDMALFAFLERASLRVDLAQPVGIGHEARAGDLVRAQPGVLTGLRRKPLDKARDIGFKRRPRGVGWGVGRTRS